MNHGTELSGVSPDRERIRKWLRQLKHDVENGGENAIDAMHELALFTGPGGEYQAVLDSPWASFISSIESRANDRTIQMLATVLRLQEMMDRGDFAAASEFTNRVLHRNGIDDDLWMICQTKAVIASVGIGDVLHARGLFEGMRERASQINPRATQALERYLTISSNGVPGQGSDQEQYVKVLQSSKTSHAYSLGQNYPNPFNPRTTIAYTLPEDGRVTLKIYNVLGQEVATLVNGFQEAGSQSTSFNSNTLPSGLYFYRLTAGKFSDVRKMMLLK